MFLGNFSISMIILSHSGFYMFPAPSNTMIYIIAKFFSYSFFSITTRACHSRVCWLPNTLSFDTFYSAVLVFVAWSPSTDFECVAEKAVLSFLNSFFLGVGEGLENLDWRMNHQRHFEISCNLRRNQQLSCNNTDIGLCSSFTNSLTAKTYI